MLPSPPPLHPADMRPKPEDPKPASGGDRVFLFIFCVIVFGLFAAEIFREVTPARMAVLFFFVFYGLLTVLHEAGHAIMARLVGWKVLFVQLGFGPVLGRPEIGGVKVELRAFPILGLVQVRPTSVMGARWRNALIYAAGPGIELALAAIVATAIGWDVIFTASEVWSVVIAQSLCLAAVVGAGFNLLPFSPRPGQVTDGLGILRSPFMPRTAFEAMMLAPEIAERLGDAAADPHETLAWLEGLIERHPDALVLHAALAQTLDALGRREEALIRLRDFVMRIDPDDRPEAEQLFEHFRDARDRDRTPGRS